MISSLFMLLLSGLPAQGSILDESEHRLTVVEARTHKPFTDVVVDSEFAISDRNLRIVNRLHVGAAIRARGHAGFPRFEVLLFCDLESARLMLTAQPAHIHYCPGRVTIREQDGMVVVSAPLFPEAAGADDPGRRLNRFIREIVLHAVEF